MDKNPTVLLYFYYFYHIIFLSITLLCTKQKRNWFYINSVSQFTLIYIILSCFLYILKLYAADNLFCAHNFYSYKVDSVLRNIRADTVIYGEWFYKSFYFCMPLTQYFQLNKTKNTELTYRQLRVFNIIHF